MVYSDFAIDMLKDRLLSKSMMDSCPKKYATSMFEAYEVIGQLQKQIKKLQENSEQAEKKDNPLAHIQKIEFTEHLGPYELEKVALVNSEHVAEDHARYCIASGEYCADVLVIPKHQYLSLFMNVAKEALANGQN